MTAGPLRMTLGVRARGAIATLLPMDRALVVPATIAPIRLDRGAGRSRASVTMTAIAAASTKASAAVAAALFTLRRQLQRLQRLRRGNETIG